MKKTDADSVSKLYYRHPLPVRVMHWLNIVLIIILLMSGLNIFNAHPALYWGKSSYSGVPPVMNLQGDKDSAGRAFPSWITIPGYRWLSMARRWHFFFAWLLVINGTSFVIYSIASRHLIRDLLPTKQDWRSIGKTFIDHLFFRHPKGEDAKHYNVLQKLTYLSVIFLLVPLMIMMGLGMSPALNSIFPGWVDIFGGRQSVRTIHFIAAWLILLFAIVHVSEIIINGFRNNVRSMITGYFRIEPEEENEQ